MKNATAVMLLLVSYSCPVAARHGDSRCSSYTSLTLCSPKHPPSILACASPICTAYGASHLHLIRRHSSMTAYGACDLHRVWRLSHLHCIWRLSSRTAYKHPQPASQARPATCFQQLVHLQLPARSTITTHKRCRAHARNTAIKQAHRGTTRKLPAPRQSRPNNAPADE